jgi:hypothetical protein
MQDAKGAKRSEITRMAAIFRSAASRGLLLFCACCVILLVGIPAYTQYSLLSLGIISSGPTARTERLRRLERFDAGRHRYVEARFNETQAEVDAQAKVIDQQMAAARAVADKLRNSLDDASASRSMLQRAPQTLLAAARLVLEDGSDRLCGADWHSGLFGGPCGQRQDGTISERRLAALRIERTIRELKARLDPRAVRV